MILLPPTRAGLNVIPNVVAGLRRANVRRTNSSTCGKLYGQIPVRLQNQEAAPPTFRRHVSVNRF